MLRDGFIEIGSQDQDLQIKKEVNSAQVQMKKLELEDTLKLMYRERVLTKK